LTGYIWDLLVGLYARFKFASVYGEESMLIMPNRVPFIAITGPLASGKSTIGKMLANRLGFEFIEEQFEENPHLKTFHLGQCDFLACQTWFMEKDYVRYEHAIQLMQSGAHGVLLDKPFFDNYAYNNAAPLNDEEREFCNAMVDRQCSIGIFPDLLVDVVASPDLIMRRIADRGRELEESIRREYIETLLLEREKQIQRRPHMPSIRVIADNQDFITSLTELDRLTMQVKAKLLIN
jgi:deoxyguanosine kinase